MLGNITQGMKLVVSVDGVAQSESQLGKVDKAIGNVSISMKWLKENLAMFGLAMQGFAQFQNILGGVGNFVIGAAADVEKLQLRLVGLYQDADLAASAFAKFQEVAKKTPATLQEVAQAGATLKAFGLDAEATLQSVVDLSSYMGMDLVDAASSVGRAFAGGVGASEILRERGVLQLIKSFSGIEDLTELTLPEFRKVMLETLAAPAAGIAGSAERISKSFAGASSNFEDAMFRMRTAMGEGLLPVITSFVQNAMGVVEWFTSLNGITKAALIILPLVTAAWYKLAAAQVTMATVSGALNAAMIATITSIKAFFVTIGPIGWALLALTAAVSTYAIVFDGASKSTEAFSNELSDGKKIIQDEANELSVLTEKLKMLRENTSGASADKKAMNDTIKTITSNYGAYLGKIDLEKDSWAKVSAALTDARNKLIEYKTAEVFQDMFSAQISKVAGLRIAIDGLNESIAPAIDNFEQLAKNQELKNMGSGQGNFAGYVANTKAQIAALEAQLKTEESLLEKRRKQFAKASAGMMGEKAKTPTGELPFASIGAVQDYYSEIMLLNRTAEQEVIDSHNEMRASLYEYLKASEKDQNAYNAKLKDGMAEITESETAKLKEITDARLKEQQAILDAASQFGIDIMAMDSTEIESARAKYEAMRIEAAKHYELKALSATEYGKILDAINAKELGDMKAIESGKLATRVDALRQLAGFESDYMAMRFQQINEEVARLQEAGLTEVQIAAWVANEKKAIAQEAGMAQADMAQELDEDINESLDRIKAGITNSFGTALYDLVTSTKSAGDAIKDLWKSIADSVIREITRIIAKMAIMKMFQMFAGMPTGGASPLSVINGVNPSAGAFDMPGNTIASYTPDGGAGASQAVTNIYNTYQNTSDMPSAPQAPIFIDNSNQTLATKIDKLISAIQNNRPQIYTQVIEGIEMHKAVERSRMVANAL